MISGPYTGDTFLAEFDVLSPVPAINESECRRLSKLAMALGVDAFCDTEALHNIPVLVRGVQGFVTDDGDYRAAHEFRKP